MPLRNGEEETLLENSMRLLETGRQLTGGLPADQEMEVRETRYVFLARATFFGAFPRVLYPERV